MVDTKVFDWKFQAKEEKDSLKRAGIKKIKVIPVYRSISSVQIGAKKAREESRIVGYVVRYPRRQPQPRFSLRLPQITPRLRKRL